jgi:hypothetical protein
MEDLEDLSIRSGRNFKSSLVGFYHTGGAVRLDGVAFLYFPFLNNAGFYRVPLPGHD